MDSTTLQTCNVQTRHPFGFRSWTNLPILECSFVHIFELHTCEPITHVFVFFSLLCFVVSKVAFCFVVRLRFSFFPLFLCTHCRWYYDMHGKVEKHRTKRQQKREKVGCCFFCSGVRNVVFLLWNVSIGNASDCIWIDLIL